MNIVRTVLGMLAVAIVCMLVSLNVWTLTDDVAKKLVDELRAQTAVIRVLKDCR